MNGNSIGMRWGLSAFLLPLLFSCATITVNVYFPDKDVEAAYEDIESGLDFGVVPKKDTAAAPAKTKSRSEARFGASVAWAEPKININAELGKMEEVQESLARRKGRTETLGRLFDGGLAGLGKDGLIVRLPAGVVESPSASAEEIFGAEGGETDLANFIAAENKDRKILVRGMAVATLRAMKSDESDEGELARFIADSGEKFSELQMKKLKEGWHYQDGNGKWRFVEPVEEEEKEAPSKTR